MGIIEIAMDLPLFLFAMLILIIINLYNWSMIRPAIRLPKGYWGEHPGILVIYILNGALVFYSIFS